MLICGDEKQSKKFKMVGRTVLQFFFFFQFMSFFCLLNLEFVVMKRFWAFEVKKCFCQMFLNAFFVQNKNESMHNLVRAVKRNFLLRFS